MIHPDKRQFGSIPNQPETHSSKCRIKGFQGIEQKILFLDDVFIGLDIANRLPLLKILDDHFPDYQIFITTYTSEHFWTALKDGLDATLVTKVEQYRDLVLNPFSHYNTEKHEIRSELTNAIQTIKNLKTALST